VTLPRSGCSFLAYAAVRLSQNLRRALPAQAKGKIILLYMPVVIAQLNVKTVMKTE